MWSGMYGVGGWGIFGTVLFAAIIIGVVLTVVILLTRARGGNKEESAWSTLQRRYASGKIPKEEYEKEKEHHVHSGTCCH